MNPETWRIVALLDMTVLLICGVAFYLRWRPADRMQRWATVPYAGTVALVGVAVFVNLLSGLPPTPGVKVVAVCCAPLALLAAGVAVAIYRGHDR